MQCLRLRDMLTGDGEDTSPVGDDNARPSCGALSARRGAGGLQAACARTGAGVIDERAAAAGATGADDGARRGQIKTEAEQRHRPARLQRRWLSHLWRLTPRHEWGTQGEGGLRAARDKLMAGAKWTCIAMAMGLCGRMGATRARTTSLSSNELNGAMQGDEVLVDEAPRGRTGDGARIARVLTPQPDGGGILRARGRRGEVTRHKARGGNARWRVEFCIWRGGDCGRELCDAAG